MVNKLFVILFIFLSGCANRGEPENYKTAYIQKTGEKFTIKVKGKRLGHPAGPFDIKTHEDSIQFVIPIDSGTIKLENLPHDTCCYPIFGIIKIWDNKLQLDLYDDDTDRKKIDTSSWNGEYDLIRVK